MRARTILTFLAAVSLPSLPNAAAQESQLTFEVDPRIELLAAVQVLSGYNERYGLLTRFDFDYKQAVEEHFRPFAGHPVVALFDSLSADGFSFDAPPSVMLHLSDPPALTPEATIPEALVERAGGAERLDAFLAELRDFAVESGFMGFYESQGPAIAEIVKRTARLAEGEDYIATLESYYGMRQHGYHIILAPLFHQGGYGPKVERGDGSFDLYNITGPDGVEDGYPRFGSAENLRHTALHEFGHSFVNPTTERYRDEVSRYASLYEPIREKMTAMAYPEWEVCVNEHIIRAVTTRMVYNRQGREAGDRVMALEESRGFIYVPALAAKLEVYEAERDRYPDFVSFYPQLLTAFDSLMDLDIVAEFGLDRFRGTINAVTEIETAVVMVVPTGEADTAAQAKIQEYVRHVREALHMNVPILTDVEALERDLSENAVVAYGTLKGNRLLAKYAAQLPVRIEADRIVADSVYRGHDLRLITAWPNPANPARGVLIYTAQRAEDIPGINSVFHGPTDYVIARGTERLREGDYVKSGAAWTF
jgi:hypothetical protein